MVHFGEVLKTWSLRSNSVTRQVSFNRTKIGENAKIQKLKCDILSNFQTMCKRSLAIFFFCQTLLPKKCIHEERGRRSTSTNLHCIFRVAYLVVLTFRVVRSSLLSVFQALLSAFCSRIVANEITRWHEEQNLSTELCLAFVLTKENKSTK